jgi:hypothetical protein
MRRMNDALRALAALAAEQHGVASRRQAHALGLTRGALRRHLDSGLLAPIGPQAVMFAGSVLGWRSRLRAGLLDLGPDAVVAGRAAAALLGLDGFEEGPLEFFVPRSQRGRRTAGRVHSGPDLTPGDRRSVDGLTCTSATLTIIHLAAHCPRREVANAVDSAGRIGLTTPQVVYGRLAAMRGHGVPGAALLDDVLLDAGVQSWLERRFLAVVRAAGLPVPALQRVYRRDGHHVARVDFDFAPFPVVVEVGGQKGYLTRQERQRQERRRNELQLLGRVAYFFTYEDITGDESYVVRTLRSAFGRAA